MVVQYQRNAGSHFVPMAIKQVVNLVQDILDTDTGRRMLSGMLSESELDRIIQTAAESGWHIGKDELQAGIDALQNTDRDVLISNLIGTLFT